METSVGARWIGRYVVEESRDCRILILSEHFHGSTSRKDVYAEDELDPRDDCNSNGKPGRKRNARQRSLDERQLDEDIEVPARRVPFDQGFAPALRMILAACSQHFLVFHFAY